MFVRIAWWTAGALLWLGASSRAEAGPVIHVGIAPPPIVVAAPPPVVVAPRPVVVARPPPPPPPHYVWVEGYVARDAWGRPYRVPGYWQEAPRPPVRASHPRSRGPRRGPPPGRGPWR